MLFLSLAGSQSLTANTTPRRGDLLPGFSLPIPKNSEEKAYLGLSGNGLFKVFQLKAQVVIIEIFSMYCPYCQKEAPIVNELFKAIEENPELKEKIKLLGIGAGNSSFEVGVFKKTYTIPFPLFADQDLIIHKTLGEVRTPYFIAIKIQKDKTPRVIFSELGSLNGAKSFLEKIIQLAELK
ncbi:MAG: redoxin [Desulfobacca sp.]|nr:redoxin [Desulfobacca sp.]